MLQVPIRPRDTKGRSRSKTCAKPPCSEWSNGLENEHAKQSSNHPVVTYVDNAPNGWSSGTKHHARDYQILVQ